MSGKVLPLLLLAVISRAEIPVMIERVTVINPLAAPQPDMTMLLSAGRIQTVRRYAEFTRPKTATIVDGKGKFLIPGLWDMHVHTFHKSFLTLFVANGITGIRDTFGQLDELKEWREKSIRASSLGPEWFWPARLSTGRMPSSEARSR